MSRCKGRTIRGTRCKNQALAGQVLCWVHTAHPRRPVGPIQRNLCCEGKPDLVLLFTTDSTAKMAYVFQLVRPSLASRSCREKLQPFHELGLLPEFDQLDSGHLLSCWSLPSGQTALVIELPFLFPTMFAVAPSLEDELVDVWEAHEALGNAVLTARFGVEKKPSEEGEVEPVLSKLLGPVKPGSRSLWSTLEAAVKGVECKQGKQASCQLPFASSLLHCDVVLEAANRRVASGSPAKMCKAILRLMPADSWIKAAARVELSVTDKTLLQVYQAFFGFAAMNSQLRENPDAYPGLNFAFEAVQAQAPLPTDIVVFRANKDGPRLHRPREESDPDVFEFHGYVSTSFRSQVVAARACDPASTILRIRVPAGSRCLPVSAFTPGYEHEAEILLAHRQKVRVLARAIEPWARFARGSAQAQICDVLTYDLELVE